MNNIAKTLAFAIGLATLTASAQAQNQNGRRISIPTNRRVSAPTNRNTTAQPNRNAAAQSNPQRAEVAAMLSGRNQNSQGQAPADSISQTMDRAKKGDAAAQNEVGTWYYRGLHGIKPNFEVALQWFARAAKQGHAQATSNMAVCYQFGQGCKKDSTLAVQLYDKSILRGNDEVIMLHEKESDKGVLFSSIYLAHCYKDGVGVKKNIKKQAQYYAAASNQGSADASREAGLALMSTKNPAEAARHFKLGADRGDLSSTYWYGKLLLDGNGVEQNPNEAFLYLSKAADRKFAMAYYQVGNCYRDGQGVKADIDKAVEYYQKAAYVGNIHGCWELALCLMEGNGLERNYEDAAYWFGRAAKRTYSNQFKKLCDAKEEDNWTGTPFMSYLRAIKALHEGNIDQVMEEVKLLKKAKLPEAELLGAMCLIDSRYAKNNLKKGIKQLQQLAEDSAPAAYQLALCHEKGIGVEKDAKQALEHYEKAADMGYALAQCMLGDMYYDGVGGVDKDYEAAVKYYKMALAQQHLTASAATRLAACYESGNVVERNTDVASKLRSLDTSDPLNVLFALY